MRFGSENSEAFICGDLSINILKINDETHFCNFFDTILSYSSFSRMTFPTRLNHTSGTTLIDNIHCRLSSRSVKTTSGIIADPLSDHFPYFMCVDMVTMNPVKSLKKINKYVNHPSAMANMLSEMTTRDITNEFKKELTSDPNHNYDILHNHINKLEIHIYQCDTNSSTNNGIKRTNGLHMGYYVLSHLDMNCIQNIKDVLGTQLNTRHWETTFVFLIQF